MLTLQQLLLKSERFKFSFPPFSLLVNVHNSTWEMPVKPLTKWLELYYLALCPSFQASHRLIALNTSSSNIIPKTLETKQLARSRQGSLTVEKKDQSKFPPAHLVHEMPILSYSASCWTRKPAPSNVLVEPSQARLLALAKCSVKCSTARQARWEIYTLLIRTKHLLKACRDRSGLMGKQKKWTNSWASWLTHKWRRALHTFVHIY